MATVLSGVPGCAGVRKRYTRHSRRDRSWDRSRQEAKISTRWSEEASFGRCKLTEIWRLPAMAGVGWCDFTHEGPEAEGAWTSVSRVSPRWITCGGLGREGE